MSGWTAHHVTIQTTFWATLSKQYESNSVVILLTTHPRVIIDVGVTWAQTGVRSIVDIISGMDVADK
jgi:hypothetical protein